MSETKRYFYKLDGESKYYRTEKVKRTLAQEGKGMTLKTGQQSADFIAQLMVRYWGIGTELDGDEREILMFALVNENKKLNGTIDKEATSIFQRKFPSNALAQKEQK
jgi:hypothetical protein